MAKKKSRGVSKSQAVRDYLAAHPEATASVIVPELAQRGIDVSAALVNQVKIRMKKSGELAASAGAAGETTAKESGAKNGAVSVRRSSTKLANDDARQW